MTSLPFLIFIYYFDLETRFRVRFIGLDFFSRLVGFFLIFRVIWRPQKCWLQISHLKWDSKEMVVKVSSSWSSLYALAEQSCYKPDFFFFIEMKRCIYVCSSSKGRLFMNPHSWVMCRGCLGSDLYNAAVSLVKCLKKPTLSGEWNTPTVLGAGGQWSRSFTVDQK